MGGLGKITAIIGLCKSIFSVTIYNIIYMHLF